MAPCTYLAHINSSLTPLDIATCIPIGSVDDPEPLPDVGRLPPLQALEDAVRPALLRPPCIVSFSGGRDSSAVLAVATRLARREGLPLPVPVTMRFNDAEETHETEWQELVIRHLDLADWVKLDLADELDLLGPVSAAVLRRHGLMWPPNAYAHVVIMVHAPGGTVVTGFDGDGAFGSWRYVLLSQLRHGQVRPQRGHLRLAAAAVTPRSLRARIIRHPVLGQSDWITWLSPAASERFLQLNLADQASEPAPWPHRTAWFSQRRYLRLAVSAFERLGAEVEAHVAHPLIDPGFLSSVARWGGQTGPGDRTRIMTKLFGGLLPPAAVARRSKATFGGAFWRSETRDFLRNWDGLGVDTSLIDTEALRRVWHEAAPTFSSSLLVQQAWLAHQQQKA